MGNGNQVDGEPRRSPLDGEERDVVSHVCDDVDM